MIRRRTPLQRAHMTATGPTAKRRAAKRRAKAKAWKAVCAAVAVRDGGRCRVCRRALDTLTLGGDCHHIVFRSQGGRDETSNVVLLCRACHDKVHARVLWISGNADPGGLLTIREAA